jgi:putative ABC transport system permease protein
VRPITPGFFRTMGIPQTSGRDFSEFDTTDSMPVAIVSEELVRQQFPDGDPLGRRLRINVDHANGRDDVEWMVVGVVGNTRSSLDGPVRQTIFVPRTQRPGGGISLFIRTRQDPMLLANSVTGIIRAMEAEAPVEIRTLEEVVGSTIARPRAISTLLGVFALVALALAAVGVYGVMAYSVRARTQEIGVRMALGATADRLVGQFVVEHLIVISVGALAGWLMVFFAQVVIFTAPLEPAVFAGVPLILLAVATFASWWPARRVTRIDPMLALRAE